MQIKEKQYKSCTECGHAELIAEEEIGCDQCLKHIAPIGKKPDDYWQDLMIRIFYSNKKSCIKRFCSWDCTLTFLETIEQTDSKSDAFITLPRLFFDESNHNINYEGFLHAMNKRAQNKKGRS